MREIDGNNNNFRHDVSARDNFALAFSSPKGEILSSRVNDRTYWQAAAVLLLLSLS
jgi:hypothetical protein